MRRLPSLLGALLQHVHHPSPKAPQQEPAMAASGPAREADSMLAKVALECGGDISASQEEVLALSSFLGGNNALPASASDDEEEVFATPPDATQQQDQDEDPVVTMCTLTFTPTPFKSSRSPAPPSHQPQSKSPPLSFDAAADEEEDVPLANPRRKPRVGTRKIRGARIRTPTPSPSPSPKQQQQPEQEPQAEQQHQPEKQQPQPAHVDPLVRAVLMIPTKTTTDAATASGSNPVEDFLALCRLKGLI